MSYREYQERRMQSQFEQILEQQETIKAMDAVIQEQSAALGEQRRQIQAMKLTLIWGVPALRVGDEYWVNTEGWCKLAELCEPYGTPLIMRYNGIPLIVKEELD